MNPIQPVQQNAQGAAVVALHAGLLFLIRNQANISDHDRAALEQGLASDLRDQVYLKSTAKLVALFQQQLTARFELVVNGDVDQATANALNTVIAELGVTGKQPGDGTVVGEPHIAPIQPVHQNAHGAAVAALHAGLLFLIRNQANISDDNRAALEQGLASDLRDQVYQKSTAKLVALFQEQLTARFELVVNGDVDQTTANALNTVITELGATGSQSEITRTLGVLNKEIVGGTALIQSPYLYLQAAGSDGSDGSASGIHLRWELLQSLETHLAKGNLAAGPAATYPAPYGFNKTDDFVRLMCVPYVKPFPCTVNFSTAHPASVVETGPQRLWKFDTVVASTTPGQKREVVIRFSDIAQYDKMRVTLNPLNSLIRFLTLYTGVVEAEVTEQLCFALSFIGSAPTGKEAALRAEAISVSENLANADLFISCRKRFIPVEEQFAAVAPNRICAENVRYFRFDYARCTIVELQLETYEQFIVGSLSQAEAGWRAVGDGFSLSDQDAVVYGRLENSALANVNRKWPRYLGADPASGLFTTSVPNYKAKWDPTLPPSRESTDDNGLRKGVKGYLTLSMNPNNATAIASLPAQDLTDGAAFDISYLQMLKLVGLDFHVARMLGLGWIDVLGPGAPKPGAAQGTATKYVYIAVYRTTAALEPGGPAAPRTHLYMTLPTSRLDYRSPPAPVQDAPTFGIAFDNGTGTDTQLTDINGYTPFDDARIINLHIEPYDTVQAFGPFFIPPVEFCSSDVTKPVFYGFKYKLASEASYRVPELSNDSEFSDASGVAEVVPLLPQISAVPNAPNPPIYMHNENENGLHRYAFYGVNWFSRVSPLGNPQDVDTLFPKRNTLLPPANLAVQLIQPEDPLILTTAREQQMLANLGPGDSTLVRCTFDWNQNHYIPQKFSATNVYADKVQFYFRQEPPRAVQGQIKSVTSISDVLAEVRTQSYTLTSVSPQQTVTPAVVPGDEPRFVGSSFASNQVLCVVDSVAQSTVPGEGAVFRIRNQRQSTISDLDNNNQFSASVQFVTPSAGDRFLVVENLNEPANWGANQPLVKEVKLSNFLESGQLHTETVLYPDGSQATFNIGGIVQTANITDLQDGLFEISFPSYQLANHPDPDVEWYRGTVRVPEAATGNKKGLEVWKIDVSGATLKLTAYDATFNSTGYRPITTGTGVPVNFHPGYRVYLKAQSAVLDQTTTLPGLMQSTKQSFLAARSRNTTLTTESNLTTAVVMQARKITTTEQPDIPFGPLYATRPNFFGKASWTMDVKVTVNSAHEPYAMVFYRANERMVLDTLYKAETVDTIEAGLKSMSAADAAFAMNRWNDLVNVQNLHSDHGFKEYLTGGFRFPIPDNGAYLIPETTIDPQTPLGPIVPIAPFDGSRRPGDPAVTFIVNGVQVSMLDVVKSAIDGAFLPLTESPLVYRFIKTGTQTSSNKPVMRDSNGGLLLFTSAAFDPSPMAVKYVNGSDTLVRFTDYTLDGAAKNIYFYYAIEMSDQMKFGPRSLIAGPIKLVNAYPAETPAIRKVTSVIKDSLLQIPTGVKLLVNPYIATEGITKFNLYRATDASDAASTRTMKLVRAYDALPGMETELFDDFSDLDFPPFGDPVFYCVVALREIVNERGLTEFIPSQPSTLARASIVDVDNPVAPSLVFSSDPPTMSYPVQLNNVMLSWNKATHNATDYLYNQDASGNWNRIYVEKTDADPVNVALASTGLGTGMLPKQGADGNPVCHRFKLEVENTSGMFSLNENVLSVPATGKEAYAFFGAVVSYADVFQPASPLADRLVDPAVTTFPGTMTFQDIIVSLPTAHIFDHVEITVADGQGHAARKTISASGGAVTFHHGEGTGIVLDGSVTNVDYGVRVKLFTDSCPDGLLFTYTLRFGPEIALMGLSSVLSYADSLTVTSPLDKLTVASSLQFPTSMTFTDIAVLPAGHTFVKVDILVQDDNGAFFSKSINAAGGSVTFNQGDGGLTLDASAPNRTYRVSARLFTNLSQNGVTFNYGISYA
jgi:hypothetical protein